MSDDIITDVLIIGCGIAGATAAIQLADLGIHVTVITRGYQPEESNTYWAQGGIIYDGQNDPQSLIDDLTRVGGYHGNPKAIQILAAEGPTLLREILLEKAAIQFDKNSQDEISRILEAGHSSPRIIHVADTTGKSIEIGLIHLLQKHANIELLTGHTAVDLLTPSHHSTTSLDAYPPHSVIGAYLLNRKSGKVIRAIARKTILATGGLGQIFLRTSNPTGARGDGLAMAQRTGARVLNNEYVQFHPTTFHHPQAPNFLISEAVRGAGARLVNAQNEPFMQRYDSEWKDLAPRDVVARSIHTEILTNDVTNVYLNLFDYVDPKTILSHFPAIAANCLKYGIDISKDLIPVVPGAHYACGGIWTDEHGRTTVNELYAVGEVACTGLHGANRLASSSLLEGLVWGNRAASHAFQTLSSIDPFDIAKIPPWQDVGIYEPDPALVQQDMSSIKHIMWNYVGLVRTTPRLQRALRELRNLESEIEAFYRVAQLNDSLLGLRNAVRTAIIVTTAAWVNKQSRGCHYRE